LKSIIKDGHHRFVAAMAANLPIKLEADTRPEILSHSNRIGVREVAQFEAGISLLIPEVFLIGLPVVTAIVARMRK
jgi:hypothetical protein